MDERADAGAGGFSLEQANAFRAAIGESVRAIRRTETTPDGQIEALGFLERDGPQSIATLARRRRVRHQTMSATVAELEKQGLATRSPDPADARGLLIAATPAGSAMIRELRVRRSTALHGAAHTVLSAEERAALVTATAALGKLAGVLHDRAEG
ncbi:helix-turn-helix domain-containing protein [Schumannella luteola]|uniref:DNA-binding MarR family transcriptional regulator n=1 Tax=Schumannella luteola TaxID=472059 RepID=A0A852YKB5_9MICO|nr:MarR family transcriptional regulator [Schumannella luteola]NYG97645.1 DNA-binding MarR family transcriptional regulator [Schumannella luteola]TPX04695.1 MarR family transcriptional regulator [Schumannella luteola]